MSRLAHGSKHCKDAEDVNIANAAVWLRMTQAREWQTRYSGETPPQTPKEEKTPEPPTPGGDLLPELEACKALLVRLGTVSVIRGGAVAHLERGEGKGR